MANQPPGTGGSGTDPRFRHTQQGPGAGQSGANPGTGTGWGSPPRPPRPSQPSRLNSLLNAGRRSSNRRGARAGMPRSPRPGPQPGARPGPGAGPGTGAGPGQRPGPGNPYGTSPIRSSWRQDFIAWWTGEARKLQGEQAAFEVRGGWRTPYVVSQLAFRPLNKGYNGDIVVRPKGMRKRGILFFLPRRTYEIQGGSRRHNYNLILGTAKRGTRVEPFSGSNYLLPTWTGRLFGFVSLRKTKAFLAICMVTGKDPMALLVGTNQPPVYGSTGQINEQMVTSDHLALDRNHGGLGSGDQSASDSAALPHLVDSISPAALPGKARTITLSL